MNTMTLLPKRIIVALVAAMFTYSAAMAETIRVAGTGVALGITRLLADAYELRHPDVTIDVLPSLGSGGGIKAVVAQAIDIGLSSRPLKDSEVAAGAMAYRFARTELAFVTSSGIADGALTPAKVASILSGQTTHWSCGERIRLVMRPPSESAVSLLRSLSDDVDHAVDVALDRHGLVTAITDQDNADALEELQGSFGLIALGQIRAEARQLQPIAFNRSGQDSTNAEYPVGVFSKTMYLVTTASASPQAQAFRDFVLSEDAKGILSAYDFDQVQ